jgi:hypothetical protein
VRPDSGTAIVLTTPPLAGGGVFKFGIRNFKARSDFVIPKLGLAATDSAGNPVKSTLRS